MPQKKHENKRLPSGDQSSSQKSKSGWSGDDSAEDYVIVEETSSSKVFNDQEIGFRAKSITQELSEILGQEIQFTPKEGDPIVATRQTLMLQRVATAAMLGDKDAIKWITDRVEGTAIQRQLIQNIDIITEVVQILDRLVKDPVLMKQIVFEFRNLAVRTDPNRI